MKYLVFVFFVLILACNQTKLDDKNISIEEKQDAFKMYESSEMALLMEQMYVHNVQLRKKIINLDTFGNFPEFFSKIDSATMTKGKNRDTFFNEKSTSYLISQSEIYNSNNPKISFNTMVDACISCHEIKCGGPIERIKTLYIK